MITLMARQGQRHWKTMVAMPFVLLFGLLQFTAVAAESIPMGVDTGKVIMVNNVWVDVPLTQIFRDISIETGVIIAVGPAVPDPLVSLDAGLGKPLKNCLEELVAGQGLFIHEKNKRFYLITSGDPASPGFMEVASSKRLYLKYITAKHLRASLPRSLQQYISSGERPNEVLIYTVPEIMKHIMEIVRKLDIPQPQVVLEVLVVDLWEEAGEEFGLDWEYSDHHNSFNMTEGLGAFTGIARYTSVPKTQLTRILFTLRALVSKEKASIRSRPRVATLNGKKATIDISLDEYFTIVTDAYGTSLRTELEVVKSGVLLEITPHIGDNGNITVDVLTEVSDIVSRQNQIAGNTSGDLPIIRRRKADTRVRVKEGDAIVIGGLVETQERTKDKKVPVLSSIPLVGGLFKSKESTTVTKEVIILITPRLMEEGENLLSDRNKSLSAEEELEALLDVVTPLEGRNQSHKNSPGLHPAGIAGIDRQEKFPLSARYNLLDIDKEYQSLRRKSR